MTRKLVWGAVALFAVFVFTARFEVGIPCEQCGKDTVHRCLLARAVSGFDTGSLHVNCVQAWLDEHPLRFDENGRVILAD